MKILEISRSYYPSIGGLENFIDGRLNLYDALGYEYKLITTNYQPEKMENFLTDRRVEFLKQFTPYNICPSIKNFLSTDYDIISINQVGRYFSDYSVRWAQKNHIPAIITPHFFYHTEKFKYLKFLFSKFLIKDSLRFSKAIICFTKTEKNFWIKYDNTLSGKINIIPHLYIKQKVSEKDINDCGYLLYIGRYEENKKIELLLKSFQNLRQDKIKLFLTLDIDKLPNHFSKFRNNDKIKFLGYVKETEKYELLRNCTSLILPSDYEAFGITLLEASNFYKPLLASNLSVFHDIHDPKGIIYFENNLESLTNALIRLFNLSVEEKFEMGKSNFNNLQLYDYKIISEQYKSLYQSIVKKIY